MRVAAALVLILVLGAPAVAVEPHEMLADPGLEARARQISKGLRCVVCRNQSIDDSNAGIAHDMRLVLRERLVAGDSDAQAVAYIVGRYGDYVLLRPPVTAGTLLLWAGPGILLVLTALGFARVARRSPPEPSPGGLTEAERAEVAGRLRKLEAE